MDWLLTIAAGAAIGGLIDALVRLPTWARAALVLLLAGGATMLVLKSVMQSWPTIQQVAAIGVLSVAGLAWWWTLESSGREGGVTLPLVLLIVGATVAMALMLPEHASLRLGQLSMSLPAVAGAMLLLMLIRPRVELTRGAAIVFAVTYVSLIAAAHFLFDWGLTYAVPLVAAPAYIFIGRMIPAARLRGWQRVLVRLAPVAIPMAIVLAIAVNEFRESEAQGVNAEAANEAPKAGSTRLDSGAI
jgi:hypothetical protein